MKLRVLLIFSTLGWQLTAWAAQCTPTQKNQCDVECREAFAGETFHKEGRIQLCKRDCEARCGLPDGGAPGPGSGAGVLPYDLTWKTLDLNGLPLNPRWWKQDQPQDSGLPSQKGPGSCSTPWDWHCTRDNVTVPDLTSDPENPFTWTCKFSGPLGQHADWFTVAYEGTAFWDEHAVDHDDNINVKRTDQSAYTAQNPDHLHTEFSAEETLSSFSTPWWSRFRDAIDHGGAHDMMDNRDIIEIGVMGLDCAHSCGSEIHPVYALALHVKDDPGDDTWAIFARNLGDEGFCAPDRIPEPLLFQKIYLKLPWRGGILDTPTVLSTTTWEKPYWAGDNVQVKTFPMFQGPRPAGFVVEIDLGGNESVNLVDGELHLQWHRPESTTSSAAVVAAHPFGSGSGALAAAERPRPMVATEGPDTNPEPEKRFADFVAGLPPDARKQVAQAMSENPVVPRMVAFRATNLGQAPSDFQPKSSGAARGRLQVVPNTSKRAVYDKVGKIFHNNNIKMSH